MKSGYREIEELLPGYFAGELLDEDRVMIEEWRTASPDNETLFQEKRCLFCTKWNNSTPLKP
jgi:hypothetical protein